MKNISIYFSPVERTFSSSKDLLSEKIHVNDESGFPELKKNGVAIIQVPEYRNAGVGENPSTVNQDFRDVLYNLHRGDGWNFELYDLGVIRPGAEIDDTYFALSQSISELVKNNIIPIVIGGGQDLTLACYKGFESLEQMINICSVDSRLDIGDPEKQLESNGFVSHLLIQRPCFLFNYAVIGVQRPFVGREELALFDKLYFDVCRLGEYNANYKVAEPHLRNSDIISLDFTSIKAGEADSKTYDNPNGFYAEQLCQIARYSGLSDKTSCFGIFNVSNDQNKTASNVLAQIIWYFLDGVAQRVGDFPIGSKKNYVKFHVHIDDFAEDLVFYKSDKSGRWWLEVKYPAGDAGKYERHQLVPCNKEDYDAAMENNIPNLWWKTLQKLS